MNLSPSVPSKKRVLGTRLHQIAEVEGASYDLSDRRPGSLPESGRRDYREHQQPLLWLSLREVLSSTIRVQQHDGAGAIFQCRQHWAPKHHEEPRNIPHSLVSRSWPLPDHPRLEGAFQGELDRKS